MMRSLYSGVSGLKTHQVKMDVIGNNIANVNTTAYKSQSITFSELMYQTTQAASGPNATSGTAGTNAKQIGLGVKSGAISTAIETAGASQTTGNPFDIRITGDSFFIVSDGSKNFFTRDGSFYVDSVGNLAMSSNGYNVMGWQVDETTGTIKKDTVSALRIMSAENMTYPPEATTKAYVSGIIDKNDVQVASESGKIMNLSFFDMLGYAYTAKLSMKETDTLGLYSVELTSILDENGQEVNIPGAQLGSVSTAPQVQSLVMSSAYTLAGTNLSYVDDGGATQTIDLTSTALTDAEKEKVANAFGYSSYTEFAKLSLADGTTVGSYVDAGTLTTVLTAGTDAEGNPITSLNTTGRQVTGGLIQYDTATGTIKSVNGLTNDFGLNLSFGASTYPAGPYETIRIDFSTSTNFNNNGTSTISADPGDTQGRGTGRKLGAMSGISIQNDGMIYASYDNGQTRLLGQMAVAEFTNASGLQKEGDNLYSATLNSGEFDGIGVDISANGGYMETGVLEMSNVDLSAEFTDMITAQRGFQANSRIITVSDTLLEELVNLKR
ncbi:MAG: flagellar hook-basal body complex protein [Lachnospiraceae bacterium]|nr:flagellar hook-basal body complex protein [Lachnospiraceae bacterium]